MKVMSNTGLKQVKCYGKRRRGSALVEFALISTVFLLLLLGLLQFGIYLNATSSVVNLSREAARYVATTSATSTELRNYITSAGVLPPQLSANRLPANNVTIQYYTLAGTSSPTRVVNGQVRVTLAYDMRDKIILPGAFTGAVLKNTYTSSSTFRVEQ